MNKKKLRNIIILAVVILCTSIFVLIKELYLKDINKLQINVSEFIECVDEASGNKIQVNWKNVCAVIGVLENNNFNQVTKEEIIEISNMFISKDDKLEDIGSVLEKLDFNNKDKKRVYKYLDDLKYYGLVVSKLKEDGKYNKFIESIKEGAIAGYNEYGILPSITIAQAILETGWGDSELSSKYNNLFGIKADKSWKGESVILDTKEYANTYIKDKFRVYEDKNQSIYDHGKFLYENNRYRVHGLFEGKTYIYQANALQEAGYSTHMNENGEKIYAKQLIQIIQQYNLQIIDSNVQSNNHES